MLLEGRHVLQLTNQLAVVSRPPTKLNGDCNGIPPLQLGGLGALETIATTQRNKSKAGKRVTSGGGGA